MANVRDSDTSLWLHNKLGTSNDSWTTGSICTQLNAEVLKNIKDCFPDLQTQVKLKLLLSFFHIPRRNVEEWKNELEEIIEVAAVDSDLWVAMLAEVLKTFPSTGTLNTEITEFDETRPIFSDMISELRKALAKHSDIGLLPLECLYLNKNALVSVVGQQAGLTKHFTLKRKPKSVALRSELLAKATEVQANQKKAQTPTVPVRSRGMPRKMTDTTPLKGLPSGGASWRGRTVAPRPPAAPRPGIKLLDIADQPATIAMIKRKRKLELEESVKTRPAPASSPPADLPPAPPVPAPAVEDAPPPASSSPPPAPPVSETPVVTQSPSVKRVVVGSGVVVDKKGVGVVVGHPLLNPLLLQPGGKLVLQNINTVGGNVVNSQPALQQIQQPVTQLVSPVQPPAPPTAPAPAPTTAPLLSRRGLSLTREQMLEAQDMFRNANRVTRPEKALILGFMAGSRENPCPNLGNIVTIKLSENIENVLQSDDTYLTMLSEMHFQMNYNNGQWTRLKKYRHIDGMVPQKIPPGSTVVPAHSSLTSTQHTIS